MSKLYTLTYDSEEIPSDLDEIVANVKCAIDPDSCVLVMPKVVQLVELATRDLENLYKYVGMILERRKSENTK